MLYEMGIPYRYEYPVKLKGGNFKYPDFTLLKVKTKEVIYLEHFGRMHDEGYRKDTMEKWMSTGLTESIPERILYSHMKQKNDR